VKNGNPLYPPATIYVPVYAEYSSLFITTQYSLEQHSPVAQLEAVHPVCSPYVPLGT
jgi:hypothetical protein